MSMDKKITRKPNWTAEQTLFLARLVEQNKAVLLGRFGPGVTSSRKKEIWTDITKQINATFTGCVRTSEEVEKKWHNTQAKSKYDIAAYKKGAASTGGGPSPFPLLNETAEVVWDILGKDNVCISGIPESMDSTLLQIQDSAESSDAMTLLNIQSLPGVEGSFHVVDSVADVADVAFTPSTPVDASATPVRPTGKVSSRSRERFAPPSRPSHVPSCSECDELHHKKMKLEIEVLELKKKVMEHKLRKIMEE
ncbi:nuclear apoptosis-inducing factor 1-like [Haliotis asinina]|uniref:nuclear apoptosis-inducing factor 1-like n=1 Tax=Haliotis asinina TaxID=109174 RepID=UPI0035321395